MQRIVYINGNYVTEENATVSVFDRGFLFSDAVYEVVAVVQRSLIDFKAHMQRLHRSCAALSLPCPWSVEALFDIHRHLIQKNALDEGAIYLQLTRGNPNDRDFHFPDKTIPPTLVMFTQARSVIQNHFMQHGLRVITFPDIRWKRRDIKTVGLLAACLAKHAAHTESAEDAWMVEDGFVTEGSSSNAYIVTQGNSIVTRNLSTSILHGITRAAVLELASTHGYTIEERAFTVDEAYRAKECFITSATTLVLPVTSIDGQAIGTGAPGPVVHQLRSLYIDFLQQEINATQDLHA